ncbi:hypothetical protein J5Y09_04530 [Roseomonas sp. PWR1]|uniref:Uncharacterized protein n=1 Tax=Roseomonas nitratireducens TaxID=2820810 RepID=A0ABS4ARG8_9PROT|nr:DUF6492 family protein [Neoroseomonas nitratireducens]MBP0463167.1 hypothetical protein [Neoroseomonas nitratireducens]
MHLVTITHSPELHALRLQARSIARFVEQDAATSVTVICNEPDFHAFRAGFEAEVLPEYGVHRTNLTLAHRSALAHPASWQHGWRSQQLLKMLAARHLPDGVMLVLDSKNHFIRPIGRESYVTDSGLLRVWQAQHRGHMEPYFRASMEAFDLPVEPHIDAWTPTVTPFPLPVEDVRGCLDALLARFGTDFFDRFLHWECRMTEFFLIGAHQIRTHGSLAARFAFGRPNSAILFRDKVEDANRFGAVMFAASQSHSLSFAIHHAALDHLSDEQRGAVASFWMGLGLVPDREDAEQFLRNPYSVAP